MHASPRASCSPSSATPADILKALGFVAGVLKAREFVAGTLKAHPLLQHRPAKAIPELPPLRKNLALATHPQSAVPAPFSLQHPQIHPHPTPLYPPGLQVCLASLQGLAHPSPRLAPQLARLPQGRLLAYPRVVCPLTPGPPQKEEIEEFYRSITKDGKQPGESFYKYS